MSQASGSGAPRRSQRLARHTPSTAHATSRDTSNRQQLHPNPPTGDFSFVRLEPPVPLPGFHQSRSLDRSAMSEIQTNGPSSLSMPTRNREYTFVEGLGRPEDPMVIDSDDDEPVPDSRDVDSSTLRVDNASRPRRGIFGLLDSIGLGRQRTPITVVSSQESIAAQGFQMNHVRAVSRTDNRRYHDPAVPPQVASREVSASQQDAGATTLQADRILPALSYSDYQAGLAWPGTVHNAPQTTAANTLARTAPPNPPVRTAPPNPPARAAPPLQPVNTIPPNECIICCSAENEDDAPLLRPCKVCKSLYCRACVKDMFEEAIVNKTRMPPRCCVMVQLHVGLPLLGETRAAQFRSKFEEWLARKRIYCPAPTCSAYIPQSLREPGPAPNPAPKLYEIIRNGLPKVLQNLSESPTATLFQKPVDTKHVKEAFVKHMTSGLDLPTIINKLPSYNSLAMFMMDFNKMLEPLKHLRPASTSMASAGEHLRTLLIEQIDHIQLDQTIAIGPAPVVLFACPTCFIAICAACNKIAHPGKPCDRALEDYEAAIMTAFHYKRCPKCRNAVKRMYGCSHMECLCGAHWCYYCQRPISECRGDCEEREGENSEMEDEDIEGEEDEEEMDGELSGVPIPNAGPGVPTAAVSAQTASGSNSGRKSAVPVDLDAGGHRRWAEAAEDFGEEPDDNIVDPWSCWHVLKLVVADGSDTNINSETVMECNRCFDHIQTSKPQEKKKKKERKIAVPRSTWKGFGSKSSVMGDFLTQSIKEPEEDVQMVKTAWNCTYCNILYCEPCKGKSLESKRR